MYARRTSACRRLHKLPPLGPALDFCQIPLTLAHATLDALTYGQDKLSRSAVLALVEQVTDSKKVKRWRCICLIT